jgi:hypothetical protein
MTTLSIFQKYELRKNRFAPGTVWVQVFRGHIVKRLQILAPYEYEGVSDIYCLYSGQRNIIFRVLDSSHYPGGSLCRNTIASWDEHYMERHYEVVIDE